MRKPGRPIPTPERSCCWISPLPAGTIPPFACKEKAFAACKCFRRSDAFDDHDLTVRHCLADGGCGLIFR
ncbi:smp-30/Cgr1 family domain protein [Brucella neotomae 5K33]|nr:smp-30/Cgr1 family domain protein [Brucella neotomae 5K33]